MSSPFPGMDPYLKAHWRDVHTRLMTYLCDQIQDQLPANLVARVEESVCYEWQTVNGVTRFQLLNPWGEQDAWVSWDQLSAVVYSVYQLSVGP